MSERIKLVAGDSFPHVLVVITDDVTSEPLSLSGCTDVAVHFYEPVTKTLISTIHGAVTNAPAGAISFDFSGGVLDGLSGYYEGEVELTFLSGTQTVYKPLKFFVRPQVA